MDPQAVLTRIFDAIATNDNDDFFDAMETLFEWLNKGGFAPVMPEVLPGGRKRIGTTAAHHFARSYAIQTIDSNALGAPFEFVRYGYDENATHTFPLVQPAAVR